MEISTANWTDIASLIIQLGLLKFVWGLYKKYEAKAEARDGAIRSLLRTDIIHICHRAEEKGCIEVYNLENLDDMYQHYRTLGGNGAIKAMYESTKQHPIAVKGDKNA